MKRWIKRIALLASATWAFLAVASLYSIYLARGTPEWYIPPTISAAEQIAAANQSDQKLADLFSYANDAAAAQRRRFLSHGASPGDIIGPKTIHFSEREINAFVVKWRTAIGGESGGGHSNSGLSRYATDARVILLDRRLLIAATLRDMGLFSNTVATLEFSPVIDDGGRLWPRLSRVYSGRLPVPGALLAKPQARLTTLLVDETHQRWISSGIGSDGLANHRAAEAAAGKIMLASLNGTSAEPLILLPCAVGDLRKAVPLKLVSLIISDRHLSATLRPFTDEELPSILSVLREP